MPTFKLPSLGADMEDGKLVEWLVQPGDEVKSGDVVAVVETHKGAIEIEIFEPAVFDKLLAKEGETLPVGAPLARIHAPGTEADDLREDDEEKGEEAPTAEAESEEDAEEAEEAEAQAAEDAGDEAPAPRRPAKPAARAPRGDGLPPPASPAARSRAAEAGIDLADIPGSGPNGAILLADVEAHLERGVGKPEADSRAEKADAPAEEKEKPKRRAAKPGLDMDAMRAAIASAMSRAKREIPHYYLERTVDLQPATDWLAELNAEREPDSRVLMGALFLKAAARAAARAPTLNGTFEDSRFTPSEAVNAGMAVAMRGGGLIAPAIFDADRLSLDELMAALRDLVARTRTGRLRNSELTRGTITVSSMGDGGGADALYPVIYPPQVAIIGFGAPRLRPWVIEDAITPRTTVTVTLSADHRVSDGRGGARLLSDIQKLLMEPDNL